MAFSPVPTANPKRLTATANRLILAPDERSLQIDLLRLSDCSGRGLRGRPRSLSFDTNSTCCGANPDCAQAVKQLKELIGMQ